MTASDWAKKVAARWQTISHWVTTARYGVMTTSLALLVSAGGLYLAKLSYDQNAAKDEREVRDTVPAIDVQVRPDGVATASLIISIMNRAAINISPLDIRVEHSDVVGDLYLSSSQQSLDRLKSSLSLSSMGTIAPKGSVQLKGRLSGPTDGKDDSFTPGLEFQFHVRIRFADELDTVRTFPITRRILPPAAAEPCPPSFVLGPRPPGC